MGEKHDLKKKTNCGSDMKFVRGKHKEGNQSYEEI